MLSDCLTVLCLPCQGIQEMCGFVCAHEAIAAYIISGLEFYADDLRFAFHHQKAMKTPERYGGYYLEKNDVWRCLFFL